MRQRQQRQSPIEDDWRATMEKNGEGRWRRAIKNEGTLEEVTAELVAAERAVREARQRMRRFIESMPITSITQFENWEPFFNEWARRHANERLSIPALLKLAEQSGLVPKRSEEGNTHAEVQAFGFRMRLYVGQIITLSNGVRASIVKQRGTKGVQYMLIQRGVRPNAE